jgi:nucleotide-binding universal stress UspA family protein
MKTIIIATDFSSSALNAAKYGVKMAEVVKADVLLFNTYEVIPNYGEIIIDINVDDLKRDSENDMLSLKSELQKSTSASVKINTDVRLGILSDELNTLCERIHPYAVVMGTQGKTAAERIFFGTHAITAMKHLAWPLITVPPTASFSTIKKIGVMYDFENEVDQHFIEEIKLLAHDFDATIHILNAAKEDEFDADYVLLSGRLEKMLAPFKVKFNFITSDNVNKGIIDFADKNNIDLLIVMPKYHNLLEKIVFKSHAKQMVLHSHVPLMALHQ